MTTICQQNTRSSERAECDRTDSSCESDPQEHHSGVKDEQAVRRKLAKTTDFLQRQRLLKRLWRIDKAENSEASDN